MNKEAKNTINKIDLIEIISKIAVMQNSSQDAISKYLVKIAGKYGVSLSKSDLLKAFYKYQKELKLDSDEKKQFISNIRMKRVRTISGVTPVTVLTKPYRCPGRCIYCPSDDNMPKSYLSSEPGAQRAFSNNFDPYLQVFNRLAAYHGIGHPTDKIEIIILGGTWSYYPENYQKWFIKRCFDALNSYKNNKPINPKHYEYKENRIGWKKLFESHLKNENAKCRCVGLSVETRPDYVTRKEALRMRKLGVTKVQMGVQSLSDKVLKLNKRGHTVSRTAEAFKILRQAGFKIQAHWMPNLYGSSPKKDIKDYEKLFSKNFRPDELKVYPCSLIDGTVLMDVRKAELWKPYNNTQLLHVLKKCLVQTPRYCRISRVVRDISSDDIVEGNKKTNFRQIVENSLTKQGLKSADIRFREIKSRSVSDRTLIQKITKYSTPVSTEYFLEYVTDDDSLAGFLRLSLPNARNFIKEIRKSALIREVHVYGQSLGFGFRRKGSAQHVGLGLNLISKSEEIAKNHGYSMISVISSIGTREYYNKLGFKLGSLYQHKKI